MESMMRHEARQVPSWLIFDVGQKMRLRFFIGIALVACLPRLLSAAPDSWIAEPPSSIAFGKKEAVSDGDIFEVVASMRGNAEAELQKIPLIPLSHAQARKFTGAYYSCPKGKRPYLIRALFGYGGTGKFWVYRINREVWVLHESLGQDVTSTRTGLIVNLDFDPTKAYVTVSIVK